MTLAQLKQKVDAAIEYANDCGENPATIPVTLQLNRNGDESDAIWTRDEVELHYDNNRCATGCVIAACLTEEEQRKTVQRRWAVKFTATRGEMKGTIRMGALGDTWEDACQFVRAHCAGQYDSIDDITEISSTPGEIQIPSLGEGEVVEVAGAAGGADVVGEGEHSGGVVGVDEIGDADGAAEGDGLPLVDVAGEGGDGLEGLGVAGDAVPVAGEAKADTGHDDDGKSDESARVHEGDTTPKDVFVQDLERSRVTRWETARSSKTGRLVGLRIFLEDIGITYLLYGCGAKTPGVARGDLFIAEFDDAIIYEPLMSRNTSNSPDKPQKPTTTP